MSIEFIIFIKNYLTKKIYVLSFLRKIIVHYKELLTH